jgi:signal transduction histidine kinase/ketosteroid isomerase-like protein
MKVTPALKKELAQWLETYWTTYLKGDIKTWATFLRDDYRNIGGTKEEIWNSKQEIIDYTNSILDQMQGTVEFRNQEVELIPYGEYMMVHEFTDIYVKAEGEWTLYSPFRMSSLLEKTDTGWIAMHQHGSYPDMKAMEGEAFSMDAVKAENAKLLEAVKSRTLQLEIEAALERVRAVAMGMKKPEDMLDVCRAISEQLQQFGVEKIRNVQTAIIDENIGQYLCYQYFTPYDKTTIEKTDYLKSPVEHGMVRQMLASRDGYFIGRLSGKELEDFRVHRKEENHFPDPFLDKATELDYCFLSIGEGGLGLTLYQPMAEDILTLFKRFHQVFSLAYQRFRDIQKAEAQAREAQIEVAVERVRAQSMAMHHPDDLDKVNKEILTQLNSLQIQGLSGVTFYLVDRDGWVKAWDFSSPGNIGNQKSYTLQFDFKKYEMMGYPFKIFQQTDLNYLVADYPLEKLERAVYEIEEINPEVATVVKEALAKGILTHQWSACARISDGILGIDLVSPPSEDTKTIVLKIAGAFNQAYQRFLDLQKAEAQAREAQIQLALERVRARTMAMQSSEELAEVSYLLNKQVVELGIPTRGCAFNIYNEHDSTEWFSDLEGTLPPYPTPREYIFKKYYEAGQRGESLLVDEFSGDRIKELYQYFASRNNFENEAIDNHLAKAPEYQINYMAYFKYGYLLFITLIPAPEAHDIFKRFAKEFEQTYTRFLDLKKAEAQAREARIEAALERVRSRSMAMHKTDELQEVVRVVAEELKHTGVILDTWGAVICTYFQDSKDVLHWTASEDPANPSIAFLLPYFKDELFNEAWESKERGDSYFAKVFSFEVKNAFFNHAFEHSDYRQLPDDYKKLILESENHGIAWAWAKNSAIMIPSIQGDLPSEDEKEILIRFAKVFEQSFIRFLDLQKAEAQAREAQIQLAMERVRARTMAMQHSSELGETSALLFQQIQTLGVPPWACGFNIWEQGDTVFTSYMGSPDGATLDGFKIPLTEEATFIHFKESRDRGDKLFVDVLEGETLEAHYRYFLSLPEIKKAFEKRAQAGEYRPTFQINHLANFSHGNLMFITYEPCPQAHDIFIRFAKVFEQTYTRFLDLQKAEAQAREARVEASLEKVRSRTMAMQKGEELKDVAVLLYKELIALGVTNFVTCGYVEIDEKINRQYTWVTGPGGDTLGLFYLPLTGDATFDERYAAWKNQQTVFHQTVAGEVRSKHLEYAITTFNSKEAEEMVRSQFPDPTVFYCFNFSHGYLHIVGGSRLKTEEEELLARFTKVFEQTYIRFLDLQKAEAQAREAIKQASLDRVRAVIASMRSATDLELITPLIFRELTILGVPFIRCGVFIIQEKQEIVEAYLSSPDGNSLGVLRLPYQASELTHQTVEAWRKGEVYKQHWNKADFIQWINQLMEHDQIQDSSTYQGAAAPPESLDLHFVPFTQGMLYVGAVSTLGEKELELVQALAKTFSIAYARYEDFVKLEQAKAEVESAMSELKATQSQLVQQEKLASLGQLTAGIAHEIKNPLNFVNNFSEVSIEMIEEIRESRLKTQDTRHKTEADEIEDEILEDIKANLKKIHEHGSRANGIVTSMLQHSRGGSGKMEPTDLNGLIKEYVNLSFHGMRAGKNPINVDIILDLDPEVKEVSLIKEDFTRVVINLCNNAFDAMREKVLKTEDRRRKTEDGNSENTKYDPKLKVSTILENGQVRIAFEDNGPGIPDEIKDKILQPFFTTKKGTEGTGLGLSITHDIVKAHGGELKVESTVGKGTEFTIKIPVNPS